MATANDVRALPPELFRAGRFDDTFFVDLPNASDRVKILSVHLGKRRHSLTEFSADEIREFSAVTWGYTGAEIEKAVIDAIQTVFFAGETLKMSDILTAVNGVIPISGTMGERIAALRAEAKGRYKFAGEPLEDRPAKADGVRTPEF